MRKHTRHTSVQEQPVTVGEHCQIRIRNTAQSKPPGRDLTFYVLRCTGTGTQSQACSCMFETAGQAFQQSVSGSLTCQEELFTTLWKPHTHTHLH